MTLAAGKSSTFTVQFTPKASGAASGQIALVSNAASSPAVLSLTGTGASATASSGHSVALSWSEKSSDVDGYNIYRGTQSGGPYSKENSAIDASASYTDDSVQAGQTYYYVVTSVTSDGVESSDSNQATATVPSP
jgi:fibronectin type 3 domain-containing protein